MIYDDKLDYNIYVCLNSHLEEKKRKEVLQQYCCCMEYSNPNWGLEDDRTMNNNIDIELIYGNHDFFDNVILNIKNKNVGNGFSIAFITT